MDDEIMFRLIFWLQISLILMFNRILPALRAKKKNERLMPDKGSIANEGGLLFAFRIVMGCAFFAYLICHSLFPTLLSPFRLPTPAFLRWIGVALAFLGLALWIYSQRILDRYWSAQLRIQSDHKLIRRGPYGLVRHPIYSAMSMWALGNLLFVADALFGVFCLLTIIFLAARVPKEEAMLKGEFGAEYERYMGETGRFLPKLRVRQSQTE